VTGDGGDELVVDTDQLRRGGVDIDRVAVIAGGIYTDLHGACLLYVNAGGNGDDISKAIMKQYKPGEAEGLTFLHELGISLQADGERVQTLAGVYEDSDAAATDAARAPGRK
jgi:hypothetical protein